jgi:hypothetical protein
MVRAIVVMIVVGDCDDEPASSRSSGKKAYWRLGLASKRVNLNQVHHGNRFADAGIMQPFLSARQHQGYLLVRIHLVTASNSSTLVAECPPSVMKDKSSNSLPPPNWETPYRGLSNNMSSPLSFHSERRLISLYDVCITILALLTTAPLAPQLDFPARIVRHSLQVHVNAQSWRRRYVQHPIL